MLRKFTVNNFKSLINVTYEPGAVNLLIGVNNSGRTNLCQALHFLSQAVQEQRTLIDACQDVDGAGLVQVKNIYFDHPTVDIGCTCTLTVDDETMTFHYSLGLRPTSSGPVVVDAERLQVSDGPFGSGSTSLLENEAGEVRLLNEIRYLKGKPPDACYQDTTVKETTTMLSRLHDWRANRRAMAFRDYLADWQYYDLNSHRLRDDRYDSQALALSSDGANLASSLFRLKNSDERRYRRLIELVQKVEQRLDALNFRISGERIQMNLTDARDNRFRPASVSNGTLRFMALCYVVLNNARQRIPPNPPLTIIEEPENGLYVRYLKPLLELIDPTGANGQYIFTSHSPYFIDLFDAYPENITLMQDRGTYSALLKPDLDKVRKYLKEMPLGELHFREMLI